MTLSKIKDLKEVHKDIIGDRKFKVLPKKHFTTGTWEKWSFTPKRKPERKLLCIHGTGRSGTLWLTRMFKHAGVNLGHEYVGEHGTVTHYFYLDSQWYPASPDKRKMHVGERRSDFVFDHQIHIVRDPLKTIPSIASIFLRLEYEWLIDNGMITIDEFNEYNRIQRAALVWVRVNERIAVETTCRYRIEYLERDWKNLLTNIGVEPVEWPRLPPSHKSSGFRKATPIERGQIPDLLGKELAQKVILLANWYGYKT